MRVGILTSVHAPLDTRIYFKQALSLARAGHDVYLVARQGGDPQGVHYEPLPVPRTRLARLLTDLRVLRTALRLRCDVYHLHDPELLPVGVLVKALTGGRLVYDVHENVRDQIHSKYWIPRPLRTIVAHAYGVVEGLCLRTVDEVILAADSIRKSYRGRAVTLVRNYPILDFDLDPDKPRTYSGRPILGYCGFVSEIRGAVQMIEALAYLAERCPQAELRIIGPFTPESLREQLHELARERGVADRVCFLGRLPLTTAMREMGRCDIGLALMHPEPNYADLMPTKMFEYMSIGLPVVMSQFPSAREILQSEDCGIAVDPFDCEGIAAAIAELNADPERMRRMGENGRRAVLERYSWAAEERRLRRVYDRLAGNQPSSLASTDGAAAPDPLPATAPPAVEAPGPTPVGAGRDR